MSEPVKIEFHVEANARLKGSWIKINGIDISGHVRGIDLHADVEEATQVTIHFVLPSVDGTAEADMQVTA